ncbi:MAG: hypothetical protein FWE05_12745 [Defluviitaleaceae bacterium]|nr:hypothetical protein [Defluviitaleaceae bacterium]
MTNLFQRTSSFWAKYSEYEYRAGNDGHLYLTPASNAKPSVYDPLKDGESLVIDALNVGMLIMTKASDMKMKQAILEFVSKYGLLGFMTALPTTPQFMDYEAVYLPKNHFIKEETMLTHDYLDIYFPFSSPNFYKDKRTARWNTDGGKEMKALAITFADQSMAMSMSLQSEYAERYDWLVTQFRDWAFIFTTSFLYYLDYDGLDDVQRELYRQGMSAFNGIAPTYHIALYDKPTIVWDFHSLLLGIQMMFSFMLVNEVKPLRCCKHCKRAYVATHPNVAFCDIRCKNQHNVNKYRGKK